MTPNREKKPARRLDGSLRAARNALWAALLLAGLSAGPVLAASAVPAQPCADFGRGDPTLAPLAQYQFMLGHWRINIQYRGDDGTWKPAPSAMSMTAFFHADGRTLQTLFTGPDGHFSTDLRSYDEKSGEWRVLFLNAKRQRWHRFASRQVGDAMVTVVPGGYGGDADHDVKTEMRPQSADRFQSHVFRSDGQGGWIPTYLMSYQRQTPSSATIPLPGCLP